MCVWDVRGARTVNNQSSEFIVSRMRGLTIFCEEVMKNPYLRNDNLWKVSPTHPSCLQASRAAALNEKHVRDGQSFLNPNNGPFSKESIFNATNSTSIGSLRWLEAVDRSMVKTALYA